MAKLYSLSDINLVMRYSCFFFRTADTIWSNFHRHGIVIKLFLSLKDIQSSWDSLYSLNNPTNTSENIQHVHSYGTHVDVYEYCQDDLRCSCKEVFSSRAVKRYDMVLCHQNSWCWQVLCYVKSRMQGNINKNLQIKIKYLVIKRKMQEDVLRVWINCHTCAHTCAHRSSSKHFRDCN